MGKKVAGYKNFQGINYKKEEKKKAKHLYIILGIMAVLYYLIPFILIAYSYKVAAVVLNLSIPFVYTLVILTCNFVFTRLHGVLWYLPFMLWLMFIPSIVIYRYNISIAFFSIAYIVFGYFGMIAGYFLRRSKLNNKTPLLFKWAEQREKKGKNGKYKKGKRN